MTSNPYILPLTKWWRLIVIVTLLAAGVSAISTSFQPNTYVSKTTLMIGTTFLDPNPDSGQLFLSQQLANLYVEMAKREPIQEATKEALGIGWLPSYSTRIVPNTQMLEISVADTDPVRAQVIANELANQLILQSPAIGQTETGERQDFISEQLSSLQVQISETETGIEELQRSLVDLNSASQIANIESKIKEQTQKLNDLRASYASFLANSQEGALNILSIVEPANLPTQSVSTSRLKFILLAGLVGLSLAAGAAYLLEYLDRTIKTTSDVEHIFNQPVIGYISEISDDENRGNYVSKNPDSILAENFRLLASNISFFRNTNPVKTILVTSPNQGSGKTTIASNLALSLSHEEQDVVLVDADFRRPAIHTSLNIRKSPGLSDVVRNKSSLQSVIKNLNGNRNIKVITAGRSSSNITHMFGSKRVSAILSELKGNHELVIIDSPPLIISDSYNLASTVDGVIIVLEPGVTSEDQARAIKDQLSRANAKIVGIVFNRISEFSASSYYDAQYRSLYSPRYYGDYHSKAPKEPLTTSNSQPLLHFFEHGKLSPKVTDKLHSVFSIKTRPRNMLNRIRNTKKKKKS